MKRMQVRIAKVLVAAALATTLVSACGSDPGTSAKSDSLSVAWHIAPSSLDPQGGVSAAGSDPYVSLLYDRLTDLTQKDGQAVVVPSVATDWNVSGDAKTIEFNLRGDVEFHDGTPLTAEAVKLSIQRAMTPELMSGRFFSMIDTVEAPSDTKVVMTLNRPSTDLLFYLSTSMGSIVNPKNIGADLSQQSYGSGPYEVEKLIPGDRVLYKHVDNYWTDEKYVIPHVEITGMTDDNARMNSVRSGQVDAALMRVSQYTDAEKLGNTSEFDLSGLHKIWYNAYLDSTSGPLADLRVRQALNYAIDRDGVNQALMNGQCTPTSQPLQEGAEGHRQESGDFGYRFDPDKARALLAEAGYANGLTLNGVTSGDISKVGVALASQLKDVGVTINFRSTDFNDALAVWKSDQTDAFLFASNATADAAITLNDRYLGSTQRGPLPDGFQDKLMQALSLDVGDESRAVLLSELTTTASQQPMELFICAPTNSYLHSSRVVGFDTMATPFAGGPFSLRDIHFAH